MSTTTLPSGITLSDNSAIVIPVEGTPMVWALAPLPATMMQRCDPTIEILGQIDLNHGGEHVGHVIYDARMAFPDTDLPLNPRARECVVSLCASHIVFRGAVGIVTTGPNVIDLLKEVL